MLLTKTAHTAVCAAYERTIAVLREQLSDMQKKLDASLSRESAAREESVRIASAAAFPPPMRQPEPALAPPPRRHAGAIPTPWDELPYGDPAGTYNTADEAALLAAMGTGDDA